MSFDRPNWMPPFLLTGMICATGFVPARGDDDFFARPGEWRVVWKHGQ